MKPVRTGVVLLALVAFPLAARAQSRTPLSVVGGVDYAHITEDDGFLGKGPGAIVGAQWHLTPQTAVEVEVTRDRHVRDIPSSIVAMDLQGRLVALPYTIRWQGTATFVMGLVSHRFGAARAGVVVFGGGGLMTHGGTVRGPLTLPDVPPSYILPSIDTQTRRGASSRAFTTEGGAGVDVSVSGRLTVRPFGGMRLSMTENVGPKYIFRGGARVAWRF